MQLWHSPFFDGGVEKTRLCLFILQQREERTKKRRRSYRAFRLIASVAVGGCGTRSARTVLALFPPSPLRLHRPIKADRGLCICLYSNPLALRALPLYSLQEHRGRGLKVTLRSAFVGFLFSLWELFLLLRNSPQCCGTRQGEEGVNAL